ncbi:hypothetical protein Gotur_027511 [Gossypium turneri]
MEESITQVNEKNTVVRDWSLRTQKLKGDSLKEGYTSDLPERVTSNVRQNDLEDLTRIWKHSLDSNQCERAVDSSHGSILGPSLSIKEKNEVSCIPWFSIRELDLFALAIYGLVVFPKVLGHIEVAVVDFFKKLGQRINPVPTILAETFRSLNACRRKGEGCFIGFAQLLNVWIFSHF